MPRALPATFAFLAAALIVVSALLPEYEVQGVAVAQVDPGRVGWVPALVGMLVEVGLILSAALMLALGESRQVSGGILVGAGVLGLTIRVVRLFQFTEAPDFEAAVGSWVDALAGVLAVIAGALALLWAADEDLEDEYDDDEEEMDALAAAPPAGEET